MVVKFSAQQPILESMPQVPGTPSSLPDGASREALRRSLGRNFGSRYLSGGYVTWPKGRLVPPALRPVASEIIAFDAFIQNPDRTADRPNLMKRTQYFVDEE